MNSIYLGWLAYNNDSEENYKRNNEIGPTQTFFTNKKSDYINYNFDAVYILRQNDEKSNRTFEYIKKNLESKTKLKVSSPPYEYDGNVTNYDDIKEFIEKVFMFIKEKHKDLGEIVIHISPGTPVMQTVWCLMTASGIIKNIFGNENVPSVKLIKTNRMKDNPDNPTEEVVFDFKSYYSIYKTINDSLKKSCTEGIEEEAYKYIQPQTYKSKIMKDFIKNVKKVAKINAPLLLLGERGVGKTTFVKWIRDTSLLIADEKKENELISLSCGSFSPELMRSELCGYKKGAFTGAVKEKEGLFKKSDKDILFLDEIGDCSPEMQGLLIRTLEEKKFLPVGAEKDDESNFRLVTATNIGVRKLREKLRLDFFDRISLITLKVPSLRDIRDDISMLWNNVWKIASKKWSLKDIAPVITKEWNNELIKLLKKNELKGNIRDLQKIAAIILMNWNEMQNKPDITPAEVIESSLNYQYDIEERSDESTIVKAYFNPAEAIDKSKYEKAFKREIVKEIGERLKEGEKYEDVIYGLGERQYKNWKKDVW